MNEPVVIYKNTTSETSKKKFLKIDLKSNNTTRVIAGAKAVVYHQGKLQYQEFFPTRGFQSSVYAPLTFGIDTVNSIDSVQIIWPDQKSQVIRNVKTNITLAPKYDEATTTYLPRKKKILSSLRIII